MEISQAEFLISLIRSGPSQTNSDAVISGATEEDGLVSNLKVKANIEQIKWYSVQGCQGLSTQHPCIQLHDPQKLSQFWTKGEHLKNPALIMVQES